MKCAQSVTLLKISIRFVPMSLGLFSFLESGCSVLLIGFRFDNNRLLCLDG